MSAHNVSGNLLSSLMKKVTPVSGNVNDGSRGQPEAKRLRTEAPNQPIQHPLVNILYNNLLEMRRLAKSSASVTDISN